MVKDYRFNLANIPQNPTNIHEVLVIGLQKICQRIPSELDELKALKISISLFASFHLSVDPATISNPPATLNTNSETFLEGDHFVEFVNQSYSAIEKINEYEMKSSGWVLDKLIKLDLHIHKYTPIGGSTFIPLPHKLKIKKD